MLRIIQQLAPQNTPLSSLPAPPTEAQRIISSTAFDQEVLLDLYTGLSGTDNALLEQVYQVLLYGLVHLSVEALAALDTNLKALLDGEMNKMQLLRDLITIYTETTGLNTQAAATQLEEKLRALHSEVAQTQSLLATLRKPTTQWPLTELATQLKQSSRFAVVMSCQYVLSDESDDSAQRMQFFVNQVLITQRVIEDYPQFVKILTHLPESHRWPFIAAFGQEEWLHSHFQNNNAQLALLLRDLPADRYPSFIAAFGQERLAALQQEWLGWLLQNLPADKYRPFIAALEQEQLRKGLQNDTALMSFFDKLPADTHPRFIKVLGQEWLCSRLNSQSNTTLLSLLYLQPESNRWSLLEALGTEWPRTLIQNAVQLSMLLSVLPANKSKGDAGSVILELNLYFNLPQNVVNTSVHKSKAKDIYQRYQRFFRKDASPLKNAKTLLANYVQHNAMGRFFSGHWNRNSVHLKVVSECLCGEYDSVHALLSDILTKIQHTTSKHPLPTENYNSSLFRRLICIAAWSNEPTSVETLKNSLSSAPEPIEATEIMPTNFAHSVRL